MDLPELYAELQRRGMKAHPRLRWFVMTLGEQAWANDKGVVHPDDARAILTCWALEWFGEQIAAGHIGAYDLINPHYGGKDILDAIEQATRHLAKG